MSELEMRSGVKSVAKLFKGILTPTAYSDLRQYVVKRLPRLADQVKGRELWYGRQVSRPRIWVGSRDHGKMLSPKNLNENSVVYSFGVGQEISFDLEMIDIFGTEIHAFDPTPRSIEWVKKQKTPEKFHFHPIGIADEDSVIHFHLIKPDDPNSPYDYNYSLLAEMDSGRESVARQVLSLDSIMQKLGHAKIDILKMDIEGAEYRVIENLVEQDLDIDQILVEFTIAGWDWKRQERP